MLALLGVGSEEVGVGEGLDWGWGDDGAYLAADGDDEVGEGGEEMGGVPVCC